MNTYVVEINIDGKIIPCTLEISIDNLDRIIATVYYGGQKSVSEFQKEGREWTQISNIPEKIAKQIKLNLNDILTWD